LAGVSILRDKGLAQPLARLVAGASPGFEQWLEQHANVIKRDNHSCVGLLTVAGSPCYLKFYRSKSPWQKIGFRLGKGRGLHSFDLANAMLDARVSVPGPLACLLINEGLLLLTQAVAGADLKAAWLAEPDEQVAAQLMHSAGQTVGQMHAAGFAHGDCKWSNILCDGPSQWLADLEAVQRVSPGSSPQMRDLARFTLNGEDFSLPADQYQQFWLGYCEHSGDSSERLQKEILVPLRQLRARHLAKYGARGQRLLPE
jgi:tRNA A-37 threonylcarbamoyl transferase component Bud32